MFDQPTSKMKINIGLSYACQSNIIKEEADGYTPYGHVQLRAFNSRTIVSRSFGGREIEVVDGMAKMIADTDKLFTRVVDLHTDINLYVDTDIYGLSDGVGLHDIFWKMCQAGSVDELTKIFKSAMSMIVPRLEYNVYIEGMNGIRCSYNGPNEKKKYEDRYIKSDMVYEVEALNDWKKGLRESILKSTGKTISDSATYTDKDTHVQYMIIKLHEQIEEPTTLYFEYDGYKIDISPERLILHRRYTELWQGEFAMWDSNKVKLIKKTLGQYDIPYDPPGYGSSTTLDKRERVLYEYMVVAMKASNRSDFKEFRITLTNHWIQYRTGYLSFTSGNNVCIIQQPVCLYHEKEDILYQAGLLMKELKLKRHKSWKVLEEIFLPLEGTTADHMTYFIDVLAIAISDSKKDVPAFDMEFMSCRLVHDNIQCIVALGWEEQLVHKVEYKEKEMETGLILNDNPQDKVETDAKVITLRNLMKDCLTDEDHEILDRACEDKDSSPQAYKICVDTLFGEATEAYKIKMMNKQRDTYDKRQQVIIDEIDQKQDSEMKRRMKAAHRMIAVWIGLALAVTIILSGIAYLFITLVKEENIAFAAAIAAGAAGTFFLLKYIIPIYFTYRLIMYAWTRRLRAKELVRNGFGK